MRSDACETSRAIESSPEDKSHSKRGSDACGVHSKLVPRWRLTKELAARMKDPERMLEKLMEKPPLSVGP